MLDPQVLMPFFQVVAFGLGLIGGALVGGEW